jgi:hypothetical protein
MLLQSLSGGEAHEDKKVARYEHDILCLELYICNLECDLEPSDVTYRGRTDSTVQTTDRPVFSKPSWRTAFRFAMSCSVVPSL